MKNAESAAGANLTVVYTRQSRSSDSHFSSCDAQYAICSETAAAMGFAVHDHFRDEGESSETLQRPALEELIRAIRERLIQRVVVYSVDRLARRLALLSELLSLPGEHAALIDRQVFERVQQHIDRRRTREPTAATRRSQSPHGGLLRGILVCGLCDRPMTSSYSQRGPIRYVYYRCRSQAGGRPPCAGVSVSQYQLEQFIVDTLGESECDDPGFLEGFQEAWRQLNQNEHRQLLPRLLTRVVFNPDLGTVEIQCDEEVVQALIKDSPRSPD